VDATARATGAFIEIAGARHSHHASPSARAQRRPAAGSESAAGARAGHGRRREGLASVAARLSLARRGAAPGAC